MPTEEIGSRITDELIEIGRSAIDQAIRMMSVTGWIEIIIGILAVLLFGSVFVICVRILLKDNKDECSHDDGPLAGFFICGALLLLFPPLLIWDGISRITWPVARAIGSLLGK